MGFSKKKIPDVLDSCNLQQHNEIQAALYRRREVLWNVPLDPLNDQTFSSNIVLDQPVNIWAFINITFKRIVWYIWNIFIEMFALWQMLDRLATSRSTDYTRAGANKRLMWNNIFFDVQLDSYRKQRWWPVEKKAHAPSFFAA